MEVGILPAGCVEDIICVGDVQGCERVEVKVGCSDDPGWLRWR